MSKVIHQSDPAGVIPSRRSLSQHVLYIRSPDSGLVGQGVRYVLVGCFVALIYVATTTVLADVFDVPFQLALGIGFLAGVCVHFTLQRMFVWVNNAQFALGVREQMGRYLLVAGFQYSVTAISTLLLPSALGVPVTIVYLVTAPMLTIISFLVFRSKVFHVAG
ncbi:MAG TPA: GtrA family protein [Solirubrobacteraceae bacterium]